MTGPTEPLSHKSCAVAAARLLLQARTPRATVYRADHDRCLFPTTLRDALQQVAERLERIGYLVPVGEQDSVELEGRDLLQGLLGLFGVGGERCW